jgi:hypothetical protein
MSLRQFGAYVRKVFHLHRLAGRITDSCCDPTIPASAIWFSLIFGAVIKTPSFLQLQSETRRKAWQNTVGYAQPISDDALAYGMHLEPLRTTLAITNKLLKRNKAFLRTQISGLLALNLDGQRTLQEPLSLLTQGPPTRQFRQEEREVRLWEVRDLTFCKTYGRVVRVVRAQETWTRFKVVGGKRKPILKPSNWLWVVTEQLDGDGCRTIWNLGHGRWRIENNAFNVLTRHWPLRHCAHHDPTSILA